MSEEEWIRSRYEQLEGLDLIEKFEKILSLL